MLKTTAPKIIEHPGGRSYHTRAELTEPGMTWFDADPNAPELLRMIARVRGVVSVHMDRYEVFVQISPAFDWDEVEDLILEILRPFIAGELPL
jgi:hypothetical protein